MVDLDSVYKVTSKAGKVYYYAWKGRGAPRLHEAPGSVEFIHELAAALAGRKLGDPGKVSGLCARWRAAGLRGKKTPNGVAASTKRQWNPFLDRIQEHFGKLSIRQFDRELVMRPRIKSWLKRWEAYPRQRDMAKQVLSALLSFAVEEDLLGKNILLGTANHYRGGGRADIIWSEADLARLAMAASAEIGHAAMLAALTGLRQGDLLKLNWSDVQPFSIERRTGKSTGRKTAIIPLYDELRALLAVIPRRSTRILTNTDGLPWKSGFGSSWNKAKEAAGLTDLHFHDLRGTAATRMYLGGLKKREIAVVLAWDEDQVERLIDIYVRKEDLLRDQISRLEDAARAREARGGAGQ